MSGATRHFYRACGLSIACDAAIPGLWAAHSDVGADVTISMRGSDPSLHSDEGTSVWYQSPELDRSGKPEMTIAASQSEYRLSYGDSATFSIDRTGRRVIASWAASTRDEDAASYLTGSVLAFILRLRGSVPLHASAVAVDGRGLLFIGESWSGKSSIAAAFSTMGHPLVSDDIVRIDWIDGGLVAYPGHPRLQVWPDSATALFGAVDELPMHSDAYRKHYLDVIEAGYRFQTTPVQVAAVYVLGTRTEEQVPTTIRRLRPRESLMALVRHTYGNCFLDAAMRSREFDMLGRLVERVPVRELSFGDDLGALVSSCRELVDHPHE